ncbi:MAG: protease modulator HflC [Candidatus Abyssobacteria bacterium SURF_17]|uniref:Protein HflC n=1 Tax=Candidatus Abyssobacteria bacterium SURF_17 TaxID=2093361 RepID=A0A419F883_9BACT|nr:MAG: protease modulator HflC [Candidatus Abyssubacteria bacterium SURF_17]
MKRPVAVIAVIAVVFGIILLSGAFFIVDETKQAVITFFGEPVIIILGSLPEEMRADFDKALRAYEQEKKTDLTVKQGAGLYMKIPFLQKVIIMEDRVLEYDSQPTDIVTKDKKHLLVDNFARWRIVNSLWFIQTVRTEHGAQARLDDIIYSVLREELAKSNLVEIVRTENIPTLKEQITTGREAIMNAVTKKADDASRRYGIQVIDVRIKRADLPQENLNAIFDRMIAERARISKQYRSEGEEEAAKIRAETDKTVKIMLADAYKEAETTKGRGDAQAAAIYAQAYAAHEEFYKFLQSLEVIEKSSSEKDQLIMSTSGGVYEYLK